MKKYWLIKSEPGDYSISDLKRDKKTCWTGVRNYQARNIMRDEWQKGDQCLFYHSVTDPVGVAGIAEVTKLGIPDPTQFDKKSKYYDKRASVETPVWVSPEVKFVKKFDDVLPLKEIRLNKKLNSMSLLRKGNRLSVQPVSAGEFKEILKMIEG